MTIAADQSLTPGHGHLAEHRRTIVWRSLASGLLAMTPVPVVDDWLAAVVRRGTLARVAEARRVDVDPAALRAIADGAEQPPSWRDLVSTSVIPLLARRSFKKAMLLWSAARRADEVLRSFAVATLFDHYCARLHVGAGLDVEQGKALRAHMDAVLVGARGRVAGQLFRRGLAASGRAALRAPAAALEGAVSGVMARVRRRSADAAAEAEAVEIVDGAVRAASESGVFARITGAVEAGLAAVGSAYLEEIVLAFERRVRARA